MLEFTVGIRSFFIFFTVATTIGTVVAFLMVPMRSLGQDGWKIAAALMGRHIGGGNCILSFYTLQLIMSSKFEYFHM